jgi:hypothetical protein
MARDQIRPIKVAQPTQFPTLNPFTSTYCTVFGDITPVEAKGDYFQTVPSNPTVYDIVFTNPNLDLTTLYHSVLGDTWFLSYLNFTTVWSKKGGNVEGSYTSEGNGTATVTAARTRLVVAPGTGRSLQITGLVLSSATTQNITLTDGTDAIFGPIYLTENVPVTLNFPHTIQVGDNKPLHALISSTGATAIQVWGYIDS